MVHLAPPGMYGKPGTEDSKGMVSLSLVPVIRVRLAPWMAGPGTVRLLATT